MKKVLAVVVAVVLMLSLAPMVALASPGDWTVNPDAGAEVGVSGNTVTIGIAGDIEGGSQPQAVHGAAMELAPADMYQVTFAYDLHTWDSYDDPSNTTPLGGHGWWDSFSVSISQNQYWNLTDLSDPIDGDAELSLGWIWGGAAFGNGIKYTTSGTATVMMNGDPTQANYLNVVLDTLTDPHHNGAYPSWGEIEIVEVVPVDIEIDIKPWSDPNAVNRTKKGVMAIGILGSDDFDPTALDPNTLSFTLCGLSVIPAHDITDPLVWADHCDQAWVYDDPDGIPGTGDEVIYTANMDDIADLVVHFYVSDLETALSGYAKKDVVTCELVVTYNGFTFSGSDDIVIKK